MRRRAEVEQEKILPLSRVAYLLAARINDPKMTDWQAVAKKGRDMETYINQPNTTEAELLAVTWDSF